jgi:Zn-dependent alcohol dehydrogenase
MIVAVDTERTPSWTLAKAVRRHPHFNAKAKTNIVKALKKLTGGGADYAFECVGFGDPHRPGLRLPAQGRHGGGGRAWPRPQGHHHRAHQQPDLRGEDSSPAATSARRARGRTFPRLLVLYRGGRLKLDELITRPMRSRKRRRPSPTWPSGRNARGVILFEPKP